MSGLPPISIGVEDSGSGAAERAQIESARRALRQLDAEIARTEARLRSLPAKANAAAASSRAITRGGVVVSGAEERLSARSPVKMQANRGGIGPIGWGRQGIGLNPGVMKLAGATAVTTALGFHIVAGVGNQINDLADRQKELRKEGHDPSSRERQAYMDAGRGLIETAANITGATALTDMILRSANSPKTSKDAFDALFTDPKIKERKNTMLANAASWAAADVRRQYDDDMKFLDTWTPEDFDVAGDQSREILRAELRYKNRNQAAALLDQRTNDVIHKVYKGAD